MTMEERRRRLLARFALRDFRHAVIGCHYSSAPFLDTVGLRAGRPATLHELDFFEAKILGHEALGRRFS